MTKFIMGGLLLAGMAWNSSTASADDNETISYSYLEGGYSYSSESWKNSPLGNAPDIRVSKNAEHGYTLGGSYALSSNVFVFGSYDRRTSNYNSTTPLNGQTANIAMKAAFEEVTFGVGFNVSLGKTASLYTKGGLVYSRSKAVEITGAPLTIDDLSETSGQVEVGLRKALGARFEFSALAGWSGAFDPGNVFLNSQDNVAFNTNSEFYAGIGARYKLTENLSVGVEGTKGSSARLRTTLRLAF